MLRIRKRRVHGTTYYYLEHSVRMEGRVVKKERYLGKTVPDDVEPFEVELLESIYSQKWYPLLDAIAKRHREETRSTPRSARKKELATFAVHFTYDTQRIEGSTLTLRETADLLEIGMSPKGRPMEDVREAEAHMQVFYDMLASKDLSSVEVLKWHGKLFEQTKPDIAGRLRRAGVRISGSKFVPPVQAEVPRLLNQFFEWYQTHKDRVHPVVLAALVHLKFVTIHPFSDGNGRISRLMMNFVLNKKGFPMLNISYEGRNSYYRALERSQVSGSSDPFVTWFMRSYVRRA
jgi:Fic family protein